MTELTRIRRLSRYMAFFTTLLLVLIPLTLALVWIYIDALIPMMGNLAPADLRSDTLTPLTRLLGFLISMIPAGVTLYGLIQLRCLFKHYQQGQIFTAYALTRLRKFAWSLMLCALLRPLTGAALSVLLSINNPPGQRVLALNISSDDIALLFISGVFIVVG